ncbi:MAG TPA: DUF417 family protein [Candidatus Acidoferrales bacterium]|nr:DUF417 family protein [Candidatus Acidoferrales bacterium]
MLHLLQPQRTMHVGSVVARLGLVLALVLIGLLKFTAAEAHGIQPLVSHSPLFFWMTGLVGIQGTSDFFGVFEIATGALIFCRLFSPRLAAIGSAMAIAIFLSTISFMFTTPGGLSPDGLGPFLLKDVTLLGAAIWSLGEALDAMSPGARREAPRA